jgi:SAM-dependent methyltransferase
MAIDKWANPKAVWDERYSQVEPVYGVAPNAFLQAQVSRLRPGAKVFVPADGYGRNGIWLAQQGFQVHSVDLSPVGVERARKAAEEAGVRMTTEVADLANWNWPTAEYDAVAAIFLHLPPEPRAKVHKSMLDALKPGGIVIFQAFAPAQLRYKSGGPKQVDLLYSAETMREDFRGCEELQLEEKEVLLNEGRMHSGPGGVVQGIFRK